MQLRGESWENAIYPVTLGRGGSLARHHLPRAAVIAAVSRWLKTRHVLAGNYFTSVRQAASLALPGHAIEPLLAEHLRFIVRFYLEMADMMDLPRSTLKQRLLPRLACRLGGLDAALQTGRGVLMPTIQTNIPLKMIIAEFPAQGRFHLLLHRQYGGITKLLDKSDRHWRFHFLEDTPARRALEALRRNEAVICNIDHAYPDTEVTLGPVLGRPAIVPSALFRAAQRLGCLVVPLTFTEENGVFVITAEQVMDWEGTENFPVWSMLSRVHPVLDRAVLQHPEQWLGWGNLMNRWHVWKDHAHAS